MELETKKKRKINGIKGDCFKRINETDTFSQTDQKKRGPKLLISEI